MTAGDDTLGRRGFLRMTGAAAVTAAGATVLVGPRGALGVELTGALNTHEAETLLAMLRRLYPHPSLGDMYYLNVVAVLDKTASDDAATQTLLRDGVARLDSILKVPFVDLSDGYRLNVLQHIEGESFFEKVRGTAVTGLYDQDLVWRQLGYEGPSFPKGGYVHRGFDDLAWLPEPPPAASPPAEG